MDIANQVAAGTLTQEAMYTHGKLEDMRIFLKSHRCIQDIESKFIRKDGRLPMQIDNI